MKNRLKALSLFLAILFLFCGFAEAAVTVEGPFTDTTTGGNWVPVYGDNDPVDGACFFLVPWPDGVGEKPLNGPGGNICEGGSLLKEGRLDWHLFMKDGQVPFLWLFSDFFPGTQTNSFAKQWNPCAGAHIGATFDNDLSPTNDPMTSKVVVKNFAGAIQIAYYFLEELKICRNLDYTLSVNGVEVKTGSISDLDIGKYVYFNIGGLQGTSTIVLNVVNKYPSFLAPGCPAGQIPGVNVHLSGVFISQCVETFQGCTPGYWKQAQHFDSWQSYAPGNSFETVFGRNVPGTPTLLEALKLGGGGLKALMRHSVAALLNAASGDVDYAYSTAVVISMFQAAFDSKNYEPTKDKFDLANNAGCPLN